ncbi:BTAD domain-containing putative transcriptional regulator [Actinomadura formosensis]|uniref:AfsR/SARP family transcriptional regulator n=1 Tax=Actinomadura formosensis TaxID=60706 RepID=UPI003D8CF6ED
MEVVALPGEGPSPRFEILGRPAAWRGGRELDLGPGKQRAVLAVLLLTPNRPVSTASIVEAVWGDEPPDNGANVVQKYVAGLRRVLEPDRSPRTPGRLITLTGAGYALNVPPEGLDTEVFQERVRTAQAVRAAGDAARAEALLREALAMWRGPALAGLTGSFFDAARDRLEETRAAALEACAEVGLELGEHTRLVPELLRLVAEFPLREGFRHLLMLALYRCGRQAEALAAYRDARDFLSAEFGVEPGERLRNLHVGILRSDPALAAPPSPEPADDPREPAGDPPEPGPAAPAGPAAPRFAPPGPRLAPAPEEIATPGTSPAVPVPAPTLSGPVHDAPAVGAVPGHHAADTAWTPPPPAGRRVPWPVRAVLVALPVLGFGIVTWALLAYYAERRRSRPLALMAAGYLMLTGVFLVGATSGDPDQTGWWDGPIFLALLTTMFGGAVHLAVLTADPQWSPRHGGVPVLNVQLIERRVRREQARSLAAHHPSIARRLGVGRPDLPRAFDDGGLADVNSAPEHVLASLPGLDPYHAKLIVLARTAHGPFVAVDDLATREILPYQAVYALRDMLIAVPPAPDAEPDAAKPSAESAPGA